MIRLIVIGARVIEKTAPPIAYTVVLGGTGLYVCRIVYLVSANQDKFHNFFSLEFFVRLINSTKFFTEAATFATLLAFLGFLEQLKSERRKDKLKQS
ncbi:hypothetical protein [Bacillus cereus]|uniref:hypothetical protein n=1 Tax=Bacillus cereus TaxID=1396 RepID=UPI0037F71162